ncbi:peptidase, M16 family [Leptospira ryugenii]|uniref:Peptidase, M16 family n=1 Tax=Leptospira ryugenii TaxID=1917863 RepID=A0A2P2DY54_9LEPT|nr:pitrilysin family protein [Leptospira ryugenii]GBF49568.1 peptidase, M16 family [Leptospira ryugenii]
MKRFLLITLLSIVSLSAYSMGDFVKDIELKALQVKVPEILKFSQGDGTELWALPDQDFPIVYAEIYIDFGKKNLGNRNPEIIRLLEDSWHYSGSKSYPKEKLLEEFEALGANFGFSIDYEKTVISLSYLKKDHSQVMKLLQSFWNEPLLDPEIIQTMRNRIADEIRRRNDNPTSLGQRKLRERVYKNTLLGRSMDIQKLNAVSMEDLQTLQKEILSTKERKVLLSGDVKLEEWKSLSNTLQISNASIQTGEELNSELIAKNIKATLKTPILIEKDVSQSFVALMGVLPKHNDKDFYAIQVLNYIIGGGGFNSYYMREIRNNRGLAYSAGSTTDFQKSFGTIQFYAMTKTESVPEVLSLMKDLIRKEAIESLREDELQRAKNAIINQFVFLFDDSKKVLRNELRFRDHEMPTDYLPEFRDRINDVSLADIRRVGELYFNPERLTTLVVGPKDLKKSLGESFQTFQAEDILP